MTSGGASRMAGSLTRQGERTRLRRVTAGVDLSARPGARRVPATGSKRILDRAERSLPSRHVGLGWVRLLASGLIAGGGAVLAMTVSAYGSSGSAPHIMVVMMENESASELIGNPAAPNTNALATQYGSATQSYAIGHPSLSNYLELLAGSDFGVNDDGSPSSEGIAASAQTLANQLETAGISWRAYMESMPSGGYTGGDSTCCG